MANATGETADDWWNDPEFEKKAIRVPGVAGGAGGGGGAVAVAAPAVLIGEGGGGGGTPCGADELDD